MLGRAGSRRTGGKETSVNIASRPRDTQTLFIRPYLDFALAAHVAGPAEARGLGVRDAADGQGPYRRAGHIQIRGIGERRMLRRDWAQRLARRRGGHGGLEGLEAMVGGGNCSSCGSSGGGRVGRVLGVQLALIRRWCVTRRGRRWWITRGHAAIRRVSFASSRNGAGDNLGESGGNLRKFKASSSPVFQKHLGRGARDPPTSTPPISRCGPRRQTRPPKEPSKAIHSSKPSIQADTHTRDVSQYCGRTLRRAGGRRRSGRRVHRPGVPQQTPTGQGLTSAETFWPFTHYGASTSATPW